MLEQLGLVVEPLALPPLPRQGPADLLGGEARAEEAPLLGCPDPPGRRGFSRSWCQTNRAAPSAPPASPAAGWIQRSSNAPSRSSRPLATQLSATPPARTRCFIPVRRLDVPADPEHGLLGHGLDAGGQVHVPLLERTTRATGRAAEELGGTACSSWSAPGST